MNVGFETRNTLLDLATILKQYTKVPTLVSPSKSSLFDITDCIKFKKILHNYLKSNNTAPSLPSITEEDSSTSKTIPLQRV